MDLTYAEYVHDRGAFRQADLTVKAVYDWHYLAERYIDIDDKVRELAQARLHVLEEYAPRGWTAEGYVHGRLLDYGCGTGRLVEEARAAGWDAHGFDLVPPYDKMPPGPWDVVTFYDSLEHVPDPAALIRDLHPEWIMLSVPNCLYPENQAWFMRYKHRRAGEHLWHWNRNGLRQFLFGLGYREMMTCYLEDQWRPPTNPAEPNILTAIYRRAPDRMTLSMPTVNDLASRTGYSNHTLGHLLYSLTLANKPATVVEIGYFVGYSASWICAALTDKDRDESGPPPLMVSVDLYPQDDGKALREQGFTFHRLVQGDGADTKPVLELLGNRKVDLLFIDGDHTRSYDDWLAWRPHLAEGAVVLLHDSYFSPIKATMAATGLQFVNLGGWGHVAAARMPGRVAA